MATNNTNEQISNSTRLHEKIIQLYNENHDIVDNHVGYSERWRAVFPNGMLLELCQEFKCCPSLILIMSQTIYFDQLHSRKSKQIQTAHIDNEEKEIYGSITQAYDALSNTYIMAKSSFFQKVSRSILHDNVFLDRKWDYFPSLQSVEYLIVSIINKLISYKGIYKITNIITQQIYIGQTSVTFCQRWCAHCSTYNNRSLSRSIQKYGKNNFVFSIVEIIPSDDTNLLLSREKYWINFYHAKTEFGNLNYTAPSWYKPYEQNKINEIYTLLFSQKSNKEIADAVGVSSTLVSLIRNGYKHRREGIKYPIQLVKMTQDTYDSIVKMLQENKSNREIAKTAHFATKTIQSINQGAVFPGIDNSHLSFPIQTSSPNNMHVTLDRSILKQLIRNKSFQDVADIYNVTVTTIRKKCKKMGLLHNKNLINSMNDDEWDKEIWNDALGHLDVSFIQWIQKIILYYLQSRNIYATCEKYQIDAYKLECFCKYYHTRYHSIDYGKFTYSLKQNNDILYFRTLDDIAKWLMQNASHKNNHYKHVAGRLLKETYKNTEVIHLYGFTFTHITEDEFYEVIQHHHVVSYAHDPKWARIIEDPSILPDFISLDDLPWVEEFKAFYNME